MTAEIARATGGRLLSLDYRLAPEHPYPAALEDTWLGYQWLLEQGYDPAQIVLAGDSAGAGLCLALLLRLRDAGLQLPAGAICLAPWFDLAVEGESVRTNARIDYLNEVLLRGAAQMYLADTHPYTAHASPLYADLRGLPPLLLQVGTGDLLLDDTKRFAARAQAAGVDVTVTLAEEMVHCYQFFYHISSEARQAVRQIERFVQERIRR
jgi:acetyl esterase/lipase